ncbi:MAG: aryl-sulfate sulfotransferase [Lachnospiraceae bacterium]
MKKKLITILVTSIIMIAATGAFLWKMNDISNKMEKQEEAVLDEERDLQEYQGIKAAETAEELDIIQLYMSGNNKNVVTIDYPSKGDIYNTGRSAKAEETLTDIKKRAGKYTPASALWAYNPYGTNNNSLYVYFNTNGKCYCRYTISVKDKNIPDFTRTLVNYSHEKLSKEHEYQLIGLVPGKTNYIVMKFYNGKDELSNSFTYRIDMTESSMGAQVVINGSDGRSKSKLSNGLYTVFSDGKGERVKTTRIITRKVKKNGRKVTRRVKKTVWKRIKNYAILLYDNSGVLRGEIPLDGYCGRNIQTIYDGIVYACADDKIALVNALGQVTKVYKLNGYKQSGEFAYDGFGNLYVIAAPYRKKAVKNSCIVKVELESGKSGAALDMNTLLPSVYKNAVKKAKKKAPSWIDLNSVQVTGTNQLLVSSQALSSIFKVSNVNSLMPKIDYIISDKSIWNNYKNLKKKVLVKALEGDATPQPEETPVVDSILEKPKKQHELFASQAGQNAMLYEKPSSLTDGQYYLTMLNNNSGVNAVNNNKSYYYKYLIDETAGTYIRKETKGFSKTKDEGNITKTDNVYIYCNASNNKFMETDTAGRLIKEFTIKQDLYRVYKYDWKGFWFS